jgi:hypothetical protein
VSNLRAFVYALAIFAAVQAVRLVLDLCAIAVAMLYDRWRRRR